MASTEKQNISSYQPGPYPTAGYPAEPPQPPGYGQPPTTGYGQLPPDYGQPPPLGYAQQPPPGFAQQPPPGYAHLPPPGYAQQPPFGCAQQPPSGYAQQPPSAYAQQPPPGYSQQSPPGQGPPAGTLPTTIPNSTSVTVVITDVPDSKTVLTSDDAAAIITFSDKSVRLGFIRKVFGILALQMAVTFAIICWFIFHKPTKEFVQSHVALYLTAYAVFIVLYIALSCCKSFARNYPSNVIALGIFTLGLSYLVATISSFHDTGIVLLLFGATCLISLAIMIFACQTKYDFTTCGGFLFVCCLGLFFFGLFAGIFVPLGYYKILTVVISGFGALLFMAFLAFDVQLVMGGRRYELSPEDYVFASLMLYIDIIYIFIYLLALFSGKN